MDRLEWMTIAASALALVAACTTEVPLPLNTDAPKIVAPAPPVEMPVQETVETFAEVDLETGKWIYERTCMACHAMGVAGAPKLGDARVWSERLSRGMDSLVKNAIEGYRGALGVMPARGGRPELTEDEVRAAVHYMVEESR